MKRVKVSRRIEISINTFDAEARAILATNGERKRLQSKSTAMAALTAKVPAVDLNELTLRPLGLVVKLAHQLPQPMNSELYLLTDKKLPKYNYSLYRMSDKTPPYLHAQVLASKRWMHKAYLSLFATCNCRLMLELFTFSFHCFVI